MIRAFFLRTEYTITAITSDIGLLGKAAAALLAFFAPLHTTVGIMVFFLFLDTASGIYKTYKIERERRKNRCRPRNHINRPGKRMAEPKSSYQKAKLIWGIIDPEKLGKTTEKFFAYPVVAIGCFVFDRAVLGIHPAEGGVILQFSLTNFAFFTICLIDFKSFLRNMGKATGNELYRAIETLLTKKANNHLSNNEPHNS